MAGGTAESMEHELDAGDLDHGFAMKCEVFVVFAKPALMAEPSQGSFHDPASGKKLKPGCVCQLLHNFQGPTRPTLEPLDQFPGITSIGPDALDGGKPGRHLDKEQLGSIAILHVGSMHHHPQQ